MTAKEQAFLQSLERVNAGRYDFPLWKAEIIVDAYPESPLSVASFAFRYGFQQGQKAAQAEVKRKERTA